eukprot:gene36385-44882_t
MFLNRLVDDCETRIWEANVPGELRVKGPTVFSRYLNLPKVTADNFDTEGYFKTGDIASVSSDGYYKILGRNSSDIIKSSGYKLSALEIEREILGHPQILECAVLGLPDDILVEKILAVVTVRDTADKSVDASSVDLPSSLRSFLGDKLAAYKQPRHVVVVKEIPRNHLGKVNKKSLLKDLNITVPAN